MKVRLSPAEVVVSRTAGISRERWLAMPKRDLAAVAEWLGTPRTIAKPAMVDRIVRRLDVLDRTLALGSNPAQLERTFSRASLVLLVEALGGWTGSTKYGLAAQVIDLRDRLVRRLAAELAA